MATGDIALEGSGLTEASNDSILVIGIQMP